MNKLIRLYNQNRGLVISIIGIIALIIIVIQTLNSLVKQERKQKELNIANEANSSTEENSTTISPSNKSAVTGENVKNSKTNEETIKQFVEYCNEGDVDSAYYMLSDDCKLFMYPSLEHFKNEYVDKIFFINRMYTLENWYSNGNLSTYYIKYIEDILASGNTNSTNNKSDYITIVKEEYENKININSFVGSEAINREKSKNGITITIDKIYYYMDYTILDFKVKNETKNTICLDSKENIDTVYLYDKNDVKYDSLLNEISQEELQFFMNIERSIKIKFNKLYNPKNRVLKRG